MLPVDRPNDDRLGRWTLVPKWLAYLTYVSYSIAKSMQLVFPPSQLTITNNPHQNLPEGNVLQTWNLATTVSSQNQDQVKCHVWSGQPISRWWSATFQNLQEGILFQAWNFAHKIKTNFQLHHKNGQEWSTIIQNMVTHFPKDYHPTISRQWYQAWTPTNQNKLD